MSEILKNGDFLDDPQLYYVRLIMETHNISGNCGSTLETWINGYIFGDLECGFWLDNSQCDKYHGDSTGMWLYLRDFESLVYFGDLKCGFYQYNSRGSKPIDMVLCWMVLYES